MFHVMSKEEFTEGAERTLPTALASMYPWGATSLDTIEAYLNAALQRDNFI